MAHYNNEKDPNVKMWEEQQATTPIQEDGKHTPRLVKWANAGYPPIDFSTELNAIIEVINGYKRLESANKELLKVLEEVIDNAGVSSLQDEYYLHSLTLAKCKTLFEIHSPKQ